MEKILSAEEFFKTDLCDAIILDSKIKQYSKYLLYKHSEYIINQHLNYNKSITQASNEFIKNIEL